MIVDKEYCMSSFLMFRTIADENRCFSEKYTPNLFRVDFPRIPVHNSDDLYQALKSQVEQCTKNGKAALALSGGIDSAILAKFMPKGSTAYTFKCVVPNIKVTDETEQAAKYAEECGLQHKIVEIYWEDFEKYAPLLMKHKGAPIHSIEVQIYKAALQAKADGFDTLVFGEAADAVYGGLSQLLSKNWNVGDFIDRYSFVLPYIALKNPKLILEPFKKIQKNGIVDPHQFISEFFINESIGSYENACVSAEVNIVIPYPRTYMTQPINYERIRKGENKYLVREVFNRLYPDWNIPVKTPMPRPMNEWLQNWAGPTREEFWLHCTDNMTGDQKWLVWALEKFLDILDESR